MRRIALLVLGMCLSAHALLAQTVSPVAVSPAGVAVGVGTPVTVTATIADPSVLAASVVLQRVDEAGRVLATLGPVADDGSNGDATAGDKVFTARVAIYEQTATVVRLRVSAAFQGKLTRVLSAPVLVTVSGASTALTITEPANLAFVNVSPLRVTGTVGSSAATVVINGVAASVSGGTFTAAVPVLEGTNTLTAVATNAGGTASTASVQVTLDTTPPQVHVDTPAVGTTTTAATVDVTGLVNDIVVGTVNAAQATVTVNGITAQVANRSFLAANVPLALGDNTIQARATDRSGNSATVTVSVTRAVATGGQVTVLSGNKQIAAAGTVLPGPLVVQVTPAVAGVPVVFRVTENSGGLVSGTARLGSLAVTTNGAGQASATFALGARSGVGNNVVEASATGYGGPAVFTHSGTATAAQKIVVDTGNGQTGVVGQALALPFIAIVTDAGFNRLPNVPVTFSVKQGGGLVGGAATQTATSDSDGRVAAVLTLGQQEGFDNNVVEATFAGNPGLPAAFLASGRVPGAVSATSVTGVVLSNSNAPIPGVTLRLFRTHHGTGLPEQVTEPVTSNAQGQFVILPAPVGAFKLMADGSTAANGPWPTLEFDIVTVAGRAMDVGLPIYLPRLDTSAPVCVSETEGGTVTIPQVPGFKLEIAAGSATFAGGARSGCVTVTPVNGDKVPMSPGFGQQPRFVVTIQPVGTQFNPPAKLTLPNVDGLSPRQVTEMYSYDHDLAAFVAIGTGTVSEDGSLIVSDPGVGVIKAGWHCGGNPNAVGSAGTCPTCQKCQGTNCVADNTQKPPQVSLTDCKKDICSGGSITTVNDNGETPAQSSPNDCKKQVCSNGAPTTQNDDSETLLNACKQCQGGAPTDKTDPNNAFNVAAAGLNGPVAGTIALGPTHYGLTYPEEVTAQISARCEGGNWRAVLTGLIGDYSEQVRLLPGQQEVTGVGAGGNTTEANYCDQVTELESLGQVSPPKWYMLAAVQAHEDVHLSRFKPALDAVAPGIETAVEALTTPSADGKTQAQAIAELEVLLAGAGLNAQATWLAEVLVRVAGDHAAGGPTDTAEQAVVGPMVDAICAHAKISKWAACAICP